MLSDEELLSYYNEESLIYSAEALLSCSDEALLSYYNVQLQGYATFQNDIANEKYLFTLNNLNRLLSVNKLHTIDFSNTELDCDNKTPLIICSKISAANDLVLNFLLENANHFNNLNINAQDNDGRTALHYLCAYGKKEQIDQLIKLGADINIKDNFGFSPWDYLFLDEEQLRVILRTMSINGDRPSNYNSNTSLLSFNLEPTSDFDDQKLRTKLNIFDQKIEQCNQKLRINFDCNNQIVLFQLVKTKEKLLSLIQLLEQSSDQQKLQLASETLELIEYIIGKSNKSTIIDECIARKQQKIEPFENLADYLKHKYKADSSSNYNQFELVKNLKDKITYDYHESKLETETGPYGGMTKKYFKQQISYAKQFAASKCITMAWQKYKRNKIKKENVSALEDSFHPLPTIRRVPTP